MTNKQFILALVAMILITTVIVGYEKKNTALGAGADNVTTYQTAATSSSIQVGPQVNIQVVASSSLRNYLYLANDGNSNQPIYCRADQDKPAAVNNGIKISTSTLNYYEFSLNWGNLYVGAVRCTASATTTLLVTEYRRP